MNRRRGRNQRQRRPGYSNKYELLFYQTLSILSGIGISPNSSIQYARQVAKASVRTLANVLGIAQVAGWQSGLPDDFPELVFWLSLSSKVYQKVDIQTLYKATTDLNFAQLNAPRDTNVNLLGLFKSYSKEGIINNVGDVFTPKSVDGGGFLEDLGDAFKDIWDADQDGKGFISDLLDGGLKD
jgi:hypothetical protein